MYILISIDNQQLTIRKNFSYCLVYYVIQSTVKFFAIDIINKNDVSKRETEQLQTEYSKKQSLLSDFIGYIDKITTFARK